MNRKTSGILLIAFVVACLCTLSVAHLIASRTKSQDTVNSVSVVAAAAKITTGTVLAASDVRTVQIVGALPEGAIRESKQAIGRGVLSDLYPGEPILEGRLAPIGSGGGLAATIPHGMRVCAVKVDDVVGVSGFVTPGMRVDVLISGVPPGAAGAAIDGPQVRTLLQNIEVKSAGTDIEKDALGKPQQVQVVNLLVTPEQAESLSLASSQTRIQLVLRNPLDTQVASVDGNSVGELFTVRSAKTKRQVTHPEHEKAKTTFYSVEVLNGLKGSTARFAVSGDKQ